MGAFALHRAGMDDGTYSHKIAGSYKIAGSVVRLRPNVLDYENQSAREEQTGGQAKGGASND